MSFNWKNALLDGVKAVAPSLVSFIPGVGPIASEGLKAILGEMKDDSETENQVMERIAQNPELFAELKVHAINAEVELEREQTKRIQSENQTEIETLKTVNETMRAESVSESAAQRGWRPFNGYMFGITLFCDYFISQIVMAVIDPEKFVWVHVPTGVYMLWTGLLGVTATSRGVEKLGKVKAQNGAQLNGVVDTIKTFVKGATGK